MFDRKEYDKRWRENNKEEVLESAKRYRGSHKEKIKNNYNKNKDKILKQNRLRYKVNINNTKDKILEWSRKRRQSPEYKAYMKSYLKNYYRLNKEKIEEHKKKRLQVPKNREWKTKYDKKYRRKNKDKLRQLGIKWVIKNKDRVKRRGREYTRNRRNEDLNYKILGNLRHRVGGAIKNNYKSTNTMKLVGCSLKELRRHLEKQFTFGMNWKNYGFGWHVDHIRPCISFDLSKPEEQQKCFNYSNLQPLWATENLKKSKGLG